MSDELRDGAPESDWKPLDEWIVLFGEGRRRGLTELLRRGFRHVRAIAYDPKNHAWVLFDPATEHLMVRPISGHTVDLLWTWSERTGGAVLRMKARPVKFRWRMPGCAGAVAELLGFCALSPYGLYRNLLAHGAEELSYGRESAEGEEGQGRRTAT